MVSLPRKAALPPPPPPPPTAPRDGRRLAPGGGAPWAGLPGIGSTWSDVTRGGARASGTPLASGPRPLTPGPKHRPLEGALRPPGRLATIRWRVGLGRCPWAGSWERKQGIPQRGPSPAPGCMRTKGDLFFLGMPASSQTYLRPHSGDSYTHTLLHKACRGGD